MDDTNTSKQEKSALAYRSGVAARLAGLSVETLRVWERRYGLSDTQRSEHGQRLYTAGQVRRLALLKQLVDQGHPIGTLTTLPVEQLAELTGARADHADTPSGPISVAVVGDSLARRIAAAGRSLGLDVRAACARLDEVTVPIGSADVLLVELSELDEAAVPLLAAARTRAGVAAVVVLYRFCASATIRELRAHGCLVARVPAEMGELAILCRAALAGQQVRLPERTAATAPVPPRRLDEQALAAITAAGNRLSCECPRHLSELLLMVGSFERYSAQCIARNTSDAQLHRDLELAAAQARVLLESAMERLALAEGLPLPPA
ncbi:MerR family transcriptional regulator [Pseudoduganella buxea]|uniref:MerR family transcriptional regulator n=1 Tax=Pseudoduganella buxea TaxID=1949069 RepID=A0A6I3SV05_9BURK|nr:MerR family transcriptional regulator [Pseudoduganella buxea]MTV52889.1 MerR family transcriptional regulator [Pseudoduganella buxea]GGC16301.1 hypothetical protein GCM10011572_42070 [Pseudoduganella buxea]